MTEIVVFLIFISAIALIVLLCATVPRLIAGGKKTWSPGRFPHYIVEQARRLSPMIDFSRLRTVGETTHYSSLMPVHIPEQNRILKKYITSDPSRIIDATGHVGIDAINLATLWPKSHIDVVERDPATCQVLERNIYGTVGRHRASVVCGNGVDHLLSGKNNPKWDLVYLDPPWGGRDYRKHDTVDLVLTDSGGRKWTMDKLVAEIFAKGLAGAVVLKAPINYRFDQLAKLYPQMVIEDVRLTVDGGLGKTSYKLAIIKN